VKLNLSKFKKVSSDKDYTTLRHSDGHEMKLAHKPLSKGHRKALDSLEMVSDANNPKLQQSKMADGGEVSDDEIIAKKKAVDEYNKTHEDEPKEYPQDVEARMQKTDVTPKPMAQGGPVREKPLSSYADSSGKIKLGKDAGPMAGQKVQTDTSSDYAKDSERESPGQDKPKPTPPQQVAENIKKDFGYAQGGVCSSCGGSMIHGDKPMHNIRRSSLGEIKRKQFKDGGRADNTIDYSQLQGDDGDYSQSDMPSNGSLPYGVDPSQMQSGQDSGPSGQDSVPINVPGVTQAPPDVTQRVPQGPMTEQQANQQAMDKIPEPDVANAYKQSVMANNAMAQAQQAQADRDYKLQVQQLALQEQFKKDTQDHGSKD